MARPIDHLFILATILFAVYSQLVMRWQVGSAGPIPSGLANQALFVGHLLIKPWVITGLVATFLSGVSWMLAMTKFEISYAYPFVSLNFVLVLAGGVLLFQESLSATKLAGSVLVILGVIIIGRG